MIKYRQLKRYWRRFYRNHREAVDMVGDFLGALSVFASIFMLYILLYVLGIGC